jgi:hypothetical protein
MVGRQLGAAYLNTTTTGGRVPGLSSGPESDFLPETAASIALAEIRFGDREHGVAIRDADQK